MRKTLLKSWFLLLALLVGGGMNAFAADETVTFSEQGYENGQAIASYSGTDFSITFDKGTNNNAPKYYSSGTAIRAYGGNTFTVSSSTKTIAKIEITFGSSDGSNAITTDVDTYQNGTWEGSASSVKFTIGGTSGNRRLAEIAVTYATGSGSSLSASDLALTGAPVALNFDLYNNSSAQTVSFTTSSTGAVTVSGGECYVTTSVSGYTITVTPTAVTPSSQTITVSQEADATYAAGSVTFTVDVTDSTPLPTHTATFSINGTTSTQDFEEGEDIVFPADPADINGKTFVGWTTAAISGTTDTAPTLVTSATMGSSDVTYYAVFADKTPGTMTTITDVLTRETTGIENGVNSYSNWSEKTASSSAVYAGNSAGSNNTIQIRTTNNNSGIVTTTSGGKAKKITVDWYSETQTGRTLDIYGKNSAYSAATELYNSSTQGTKLGSIVKGTSTELTITDDYEYIGLRSSGSAMYFNSISIDWETGTPDTYSDYCTTVVAAAVEKPVITVAKNPFLFSTTATITCATAGATIKYSYDETSWSDYTSAMTITETTTIYAKAIKGNDESSVAQVTATKNLATPTVTIDATGITNTNVYAGTDAGSLSATVTYNDAAIPGASVTWSGNNDAVATIDASTGAVTLVAAGSVTFTATYAGNDDYSEKAATYEMTVTNSDPNAPGTETNPYTVAQAIAATPTTENVYISGKVCSFYNTSITGDGSNYRYYISDDGTTDTKLLVYKGKGLNETTFADANDLLVGDEVVICGKLTMYQNAPEVASGNYLFSRNRPVDTTPSITANSNSVNLNANAHNNGEITVTYNNITTVAADVIFCDANGDAATYSWITASINGDNNVAYSVEENTGDEARTAYLKVHALDNDNNDVYSPVITITQAKPVVDYATLPFSYDGNALETSLPEGLTQGGLSGKYNSSPAMKFDDTDDYLILKLNEAPGMIAFDIKGNGFSGGTFTVQTSADGATYSDFETFTVLGDKTTETRYNHDPDVRYIKWIYTEKKTGNVALGNIKVLKETSATITLNAACTDGTLYYGTYSNENAFVVPDGLTVSEIGLNYLDNLVVENYKTGDVVPANTGVMVSSNTAGDHMVLLSGAAGTPASTDNCLRATGDGITAEAMAAADANCTFYRLTMHNGTDLGFYWGAANGAAFAVGANKAYLAVEKGSDLAREFFAIGNLGEATAINSVKRAVEAGVPAYNLQGQRVDSNVKGILIVNGKKVFNK